jgi:putative hydrolase of the HAD superfamily
MDFMRMKRAAVDAAVDAMIDAGLPMHKEQLREKIFEIYWKEGIEDQNIFDKVLMKEFGKVDPKILAAGIIGYKRAKEGHMTLYPHVKMALTDLLKMGVRMGVVSDAPRLSVWMRIVGLGLHHYFEHVVTFEDTGEKKPSPKPFKKVLSLMEVEPTAAIMVGDWAERDIKGAKALGMKTAWAKYGNEFDTPVSGADYELDDIYNLVAIVRRENEKAR